jgi:sodium transport system ATP-binding protein
VISTHIMQEVERLCDHIYVVSHGTVVANDTVAGLKSTANETDFEEAFVKLAFAEAR